MTTLLINNELGQRARLAGECQGKTFDQFVDDVLRQAVGGKEIQIGSRNGLPGVLVPPGTATIEPAAVTRAWAEKGI